MSETEFPIDSSQQAMAAAEEEADREWQEGAYEQFVRDDAAEDTIYDDVLTR